MAKNPLFITDTILRDAHQSQAATRMRIEDMLPACKILDDIGYWSLECWGGATFDSCMRFLNEDPWERLRTSQHFFHHWTSRTGKSHLYNNRIVFQINIIN